MSTTPNPTLDDLLAHTRWVEDLARSLVRDPNAAADLAQSTMMIAWQRRDRPPRDVRSWLATVLRNKVRERGRREATRGEVERRSARPEALPSAADVLERAESERGIVDAVLALEEPHRGTLLLRYFEGLSLEDIAHRSGSPISTISSRLTRAHARLREVLSRERGGGDWIAAIAPVLLRPSSTSAITVSHASGVLFMSTVVKILVAAVSAALLAWWVWPTSKPDALTIAIEPAKTAETTAEPTRSAQLETSAAASAARVAADATPSMRTGPAVAPVAEAPKLVVAAVGGRIFGRVLRPDGSAASKRKVRMLLMGKGPELFVVTDDTGAFDERDLDPGVWALSTWPDEAELALLGKANEDTLNGMTYMRQETLDLERGAEREVVLGLNPKDAVRVHGRMSRGGVAADGYMTWLPDGHDAMDRQRLATVDRDGRYEAVLDAPGRHLLVAILQETRQEFVVDVPPGADFEHDIVMSDVDLKGRVVTSDGKPVIGAHVDLVPRGGHNPRHPSANVVFSRRTDAEGKFSFRCLPQARYMLSTNSGTVGKGKGGVPVGAAVALDVDTARIGGTDEFVLNVDTGVRVCGRVTSTTGSVASVSVFVFDARGEPLNALDAVSTDKEGRFETFALTRGSYFGVAANGLSWSDVTRFEVPKEGDASELTLALSPAATLTVDVSGWDSAWIDVRDANHCALSSVFDKQVFNRIVNRDWSSSSFVYRLPSGNYDVTAVGASSKRTARVALISADAARVRVAP